MSKIMEKKFDKTKYVDSYRKKHKAQFNVDLNIEEKEELEILLKNSNLSTAMLGHLSKESNFPELAYQTVIDEIISNHSDDKQINLSVANRDCPSKLITL